MQKINARSITLVIIFILILLVIALFVGKVTFSYIAPLLDNEVIKNGEVTADGDRLIFLPGGKVDWQFNGSSFNYASNSITKTIRPSVTLISSKASLNQMAEASSTYYAGINITANTYTYTTAGHTPELLLTIKDENGDLVTEIDSNLTYYSDLTDRKGNTYSGFDITGLTGDYAIFLNHVITSVGTSYQTATTHTLEISITFLNLESDQSANESANFNMKAILKKDVTSIVTEEEGEYLASKIISKYDPDNEGKNSIYYHDKKGPYATYEIGDNSYRFAGGEYELTTEGKASGYTNVSSYYNVTGASNAIRFYCGSYETAIGSTCTTSYTFENERVYYIVGADTTKYKTLQEAYDVAVEKGLIKEIPINNYVCFGSDVVPCPSENLYRIIGVINGKVRLIKNEMATNSQIVDSSQPSDYNPTDATANLYSGARSGYVTLIKGFYWNNVNSTQTYATYSDRAVWRATSLNLDSLNGYYLNTYLGGDSGVWKNKIEDTDWFSKGIASTSFTANYGYNTEFSSDAANITNAYALYKAKVGLVYVSDYLYAADPTNWSVTSTYSNTIKNWMYSGLSEWTITRYNSGYAFYISNNGNVTYSGINSSFAIRPAFDLKRNVKYASGTGSKTDPYRIVLN